MEASIRERREGWKGERDQHPPRQTPSNALTNSSISSHVPTPRAAHLAVPFPHRPPPFLLPAHEPQLRAPRPGTDAQHEHPGKTSRTASRPPPPSRAPRRAARGSPSTMCTPRTVVRALVTASSLARWTARSNDAEALVETVRRHTIAGRNVYAAYLLEVPRSMDLDVE